MKKSDIKKLILMALTYRVSIKSLEENFNVTRQEIVEYASGYDYLERALYVLYHETLFEAEEIQEKALKEAKIFWIGRKKCIYDYNQAKKEGKSNEEQRRLLNRYKAWIDRIGDKEFIEIAKKEGSSRLTNEEKEVCVRHRLKYGLSLRDIGHSINLNKDVIRQYEEKKAQQDPIYAAKRTNLNEINSSIRHIINHHDLGIAILEDQALRK